MKRFCRLLVLFGLVAFLLLATAPAASAQKPGPYIGVFGGLAIPDDLRWGWGDYYDDWGYDEDPDESWALGVKFGYIFPQLSYMAFELEYTCLGDQDYGQTWSYRRSNGDQVIDSYDGDFSAHNVMANLLFRYPYGRVHPYVGFGLGLSMGNITEKGTREVNGQLYDSYDIDEDDAAFATQFILGVNFEIAPNLSAELAYKYFYSEYDIINYDIEAEDHLFTLGLNVHF
ncbi:outer membrane protein [Syntrophus aciditrophicus]|nr:outer membrane beta-barrel protein [Syntrophus aciditrophicus]